MAPKLRMVAPTSQAEVMACRGANVRLRFKQPPRALRLWDTIGVAPSAKPRRRLRSKTSAIVIKTRMGMARALSAALAAEATADDELAPLPSSARRTHVHWTHVHTQSPAHVQPSTMDRKAFWAHLEKVYAEVYPDADSPTGSILSFGLVASEQHKRAKQDGHRHPHKHAATFCSKQHYWNKVAKVSLAKYNVPLNAVAHDSYATMYAYLRRPTKKKPLSELDAEPYMSDLHPKGDALALLLESSKRANELLCTRSGEPEQKRKRIGVFQDIATNRLRSVADLRAFAASEAASGRHSLADFCTRQGHKLDDVVQHAWAVIEAPSAPVEVKTLVEKLADAAKSLPCECGGAWQQGAVDVLQRNGISPTEFAHSIYRALEHGARRGTNVACVGKGGCGKSTLLESLEKIFNCAPKVEEGSTFPFASLMDGDIMLWQDYEHDEKTVRFTDLLSWFVGESVGVRMPGRTNKKVRNQAPCFYSGHTLLEVRSGHRHSPTKVAMLNEMMAERFTIFRFTEPVPKEKRMVSWPHCGRCAANFYLGGDDTTTAGAAGADAGSGHATLSCSASCIQPPPASPSSLVSALSELAHLHSSGALTPEEFQAAKRKVLQ